MSDKIGTSRGHHPRETKSDDDERLRTAEVVRITLGDAAPIDIADLEGGSGAKKPAVTTESRFDLVAEEEPLEIRVRGVSVAITMRTPGHDEELVRGFLWTEGVVDDPDDITRIAHCTRVEDPEAEDNVIDVTLRPDLDFDVESLRRHIFAHSSCGVCGKATLEAALKKAPALDDERTLSPLTLAGLPARLRRGQEVFDRTGGIHAAGVLVAEDDAYLKVVREDVGRHNAIDKVVGVCVGDTPALALVVSGRVSFEVVQKAARARWPFIVAISAPTSLAVRLADTLGITLVGFVRDRSMNVYCHAHRVVSWSDAQ